MNQYEFPKIKRKNLITKMIIITEKGDLIYWESEESTNIAKSKVITAPAVIVPIN